MNGSAFYGAVMYAHIYLYIYMRVCVSDCNILSGFTAGDQRKIVAKGYAIWPGPIYKYHIQKNDYRMMAFILYR